MNFRTVQPEDGYNSNSSSSDLESVVHILTNIKDQYNTDNYET
jgi:hypothetical protein